jgi:hypothetical protein
MVAEFLNRARSSSHELDTRLMAGRSSKEPVAGDQRHSERFGKRNIDRVVSREIVSQVPDARQHETVRVPVQRESRENRKSRAAAFAVNLATDRVAPDGVRDLDIDQMRGMQRRATANSRSSMSRAGGVCRSTSTRAEASTTITRGRARPG